jgi:hypothetical protein
MANPGSHFHFSYCCLFWRLLRLETDVSKKVNRRTIASSEQEAASTLALTPESDSRCHLSLTQALGGSEWPTSRYFTMETCGKTHRIPPRISVFMFGRMAVCGERF